MRVARDVRRRVGSPEDSAWRGLGNSLPHSGEPEFVLQTIKETMQTQTTLADRVREHQAEANKAAELNAVNKEKRADKSRKAGREWAESTAKVGELESLLRSSRSSHGILGAEIVKPHANGLCTSSFAEGALEAYREALKVNGVDPDLVTVLVKTY